MAYAHGSVVLAPASHRAGLRPYLVGSNASRPFFGNEYTVAVITTTERRSAVELAPESLREGRLKEYPSFLNAWSHHDFPHGQVVKRVTQVLLQLLSGGLPTGFMTFSRRKPTGASEVVIGYRTTIPNGCIRSNQTRPESRGAVH